MAKLITSFTVTWSIMVIAMFVYIIIVVIIITKITKNKYFVNFKDWHLGGKCDVFLWGAGRHGQLAEAGRNILVPTLAPSFSQALQV